jgi:hypothetical protein
VKCDKLHDLIVKENEIYFIGDLFVKSTHTHTNHFCRHTNEVKQRVNATLVI